MYNKEYYRKNKDKYIESNRKWREKNREYMREYEQKRYEKKKVNNLQDMFR